MKLIAFALLFTTQIYAAEVDCVENTALKEVEIFAGLDCLKDIDHNYLDMEINGVPETKTFCENCKNDAFDKLTSTKEANEDNESSLGRATLNELQKELTFITMDLVKVRAPISLDFDAKSAIQSCNTNDKLQPPTGCVLSETQKKAFNEQVTSIKNSLATELSNILSETPNLSYGLMVRTEDKQCTIKDASAIYSKMRFVDTLITPEIIAKLKSFDYPKDLKSIDDYLNKTIKDQTFLTAYKDISTHPVLGSLLRDPKEFKKFLSEFNIDKKTKTLKETNPDIVGKLYAKYAKVFGADISKRCDNAFAKTKKYLDDIFCKNTPRYLADNLDTMDSIHGSQLKNGERKDANQALQTHCSLLNKNIGKYESFKTIREDICTSSHKMLTTLPITEFKKQGYNQLIGNAKQKLCMARNTKACLPGDLSQDCQMLSYYEHSKSSEKNEKESGASGDNINLILRSLIGDGQPMRDGKVDNNAVTLLKDEGILPGVKKTATATSDAKSFYKTVHNEIGNQGQSGGNKTTPQTTPTDEQITPQPNTFSPAAIGSDDVDPNAGSKEKKSTKGKVGNNKKGAPTPTPNFSNLDQDNQNALTDRLKRMKAGNEEISDNSELPNIGGDELGGNNGSFSVGNQKINGGPVFNNVGKIDKSIINNVIGNNVVKTKKEDGDVSYEKAKVEAQEFINQTGGNVTSVPDLTINVSRKPSGDNELSIADVDVKNLDKKEFRDKLSEEITQVINEEQVKKGEKFVLKLSNELITIELKNGVYVAEFDNKDLNKKYASYLDTLSKYFTSIKNGGGKLESMRLLLLNQDQ